MTVETREHTLEDIAQALVAPGRGILAADESTGTITRRLASIGAESTEDSRRAWRQLLFSTQGAGEYISGVILYDETLRQSANDGRAFVDVLRGQDIIPGIKVDLGAKPLAGADGEQVTEGLDGLRDRLDEYAKLGAKFTKWRGVIAIGDHIPSDYCIGVNAHALGRFAALSQEAGLVPIVEPEVLMDGDHDIGLCRWATERALRAVFAELAAQRVSLEGMLLKPNMVLSGADAPERAGRRGSGDDDRVLQAHRARRRPRHRLPFRRPVRRRGDGEPERDEPRRPRPPLGAQLLLWPRTPGHAAGDLGAASRRTSPRRSGPS